MTDLKTQFVKIYRCCNCGATNNPENHICDCCGKLFLGEMHFEEWVELCSSLSNKAALKEGKD